MNLQEATGEAMSDKLREAAENLIARYYSRLDTTRPRDIEKLINKLQAALADSATTAPQTELMDLHAELDRRFPLFNDLQEFVSRPTRHTNHSVPCPTCGNYWADEDEAADAPPSTNPGEPTDEMVELFMWSDAVKAGLALPREKGKTAGYGDLETFVEKTEALRAALAVQQKAKR